MLAKLWGAGWYKWQGQPNERNLGTRENVPVPSDKVTHGSDGEIDDEVHAAGVELVDKAAPCIDGAPVRVEKGEINGRVTCQQPVRNAIPTRTATGPGTRKKSGKLTVCLPGHVEERSTSDVDSADTHALEVVEMVEDALEIATIAEVLLAPVVFEEGLEVVVIGGISVSELVEEDGVDGEGTPVGGRGRVGGVGAGGVVVEDVLGVLVGVDVVVCEIVHVADGGCELGGGSEEGDGEGEETTSDALGRWFPPRWREREHAEHAFDGGGEERVVQ